MLRDRISDLRLALMTLTRIPVGIGPLPPGTSLARAVWAYPLVGTGVGVLGGFVYWAAAKLSLPAPALELAALVLLTGALHEDGLADFCDGLGGPERIARLAIMKDSRIGVYGTVALIVVFLARYSAISAIGAPGAVMMVSIGACALSRGMIAIPLLLPPARSDGLGFEASRPPSWSIGLALLLGGAIAVLTTGLGSVALIAAALALSLIVTAIARHNLGGQTGDVLGATALLSETAAFLAASAKWI